MSYRAEWLPLPPACLSHVRFALPCPADFFCLYNGNEGLSQRAGASLDVYAPPPPVRMHT